MKPAYAPFRPLVRGQKSSRDSRSRRRLLFPERLEARQLLATFAVNTELDTIDVDLADGLALDASGNTSLRAAIMQANALPDSDLILLPAGNYRLTEQFDDSTSYDVRDDAFGDLDVDLGQVVIEGAGSGSTVIDATAVVDRVLEVGPEASLRLSGVRLTGGNAGLQQGGGALLNTGNATLDSVWIDDNQASVGGGIQSLSGDLSIANSTISNNFAHQAGGGIAVGGFRTGSSGTVVIQNSTISANAAETLGGGIYYQTSFPAQLVNLTYVTLVENQAGTGAGIAGPPMAQGGEGGGSSSPFTVHASIVSNNLAQGEADVVGDFTSLGSNLIGAATLDSGFVNGLMNDLVGTSAAPLDAGLAPLQVFAASPTPVHPLLAISPARNRVSPNPAEPIVDQRGRSRTADLAPDSGAFEFVGDSLLVDIFHDRNADGSQDVDEPLTPFSITATLTLDSAAQDPTQLVYRGPAPAHFAELPPGPYTVAVEFDDPHVLPTLSNASGVLLGDESSSVALLGGIRLGEIHGYKFDDLAQDGIDDSGDPRLVGVEFTLWNLGDDGLVGTQDDFVHARTTTGPFGTFSFVGLPNGSYRVVESLPLGSFATTPPVPTMHVVGGSLFVPDALAVDPQLGQSVEALSELAVGNVTPGSVLGRVVFDLQSDGLLTDDPGIATFELTLTGAGYDAEFGTQDDLPALKTVSAADGSYAFEGLSQVGLYRLELSSKTHYFHTTQSSVDFILPANAVVVPSQGFIDAGDDSRRSLVELPQIAFGVMRWGALMGVTFDDLNADGDQFDSVVASQRDPGELNRGAQRIDLYDANDSQLLESTESSANADANLGYFLFEDLSSGNYALDQWLAPDRGLTSSETPFAVSPGVLYLAPGVQRDSELFPLEEFEVGLVQEVVQVQLAAGSRELVELSGNILDDLNADGTRDTNELGLAGWTVVLQRTTRTYYQDNLPDTRVAVTDASGNYALRVWPGEYEVAYLLQPGFEPTGPQARFSNYLGFESGSGSSVSKVSGVTLADLNADAVDDLLIVNDYADIVDKTSNIEILLSRDAAQRERVVLELGASARPQHVVAVDIDNDQDLDIVVAMVGRPQAALNGQTDAAYGDVVIFRNQSGQFERVTAAGTAASVPLPSGSQSRSVHDSLAGNGPSHISYGDLNGDNLMDLVVTNAIPYDVESNDQVSHAEDVSIVLQTSPGVFAKSQTLDLSTADLDAGVISTAVGDFNGDQWLDIAVGAPGSQRIEIYFGDSSGSFDATRVQYLTDVQRPTHLLAHNLDLDAAGTAELVVADYAANQIAVYSYDPQVGQLGDAPHRIDTIDKPQWLAIGDLNADGTPDIAASFASTNVVQPIFNLGNNRFALAATPDIAHNLQFTSTAPNGLNSAFGKLAIGNLDGNDFGDVAVAQFTSGVTAYLNLVDDYVAWRAARPSGDASILLGESHFVDFNAVGQQDATVEATAQVVSADRSYLIAAFTELGFEQHVAVTPFANVEIGQATQSGRRLTLAEAPRQLTQHNYRDPFDVNGDGSISPVDALLVINELNRGASSGASAVGLSAAYQVDTSGDGVLSPVDALNVINHLNGAHAEEASLLRRHQIEVQDLQPIATGLIEALRSAGLAADAVERLQSVDFVIGDLPGGTLAETVGRTVYVDSNAAGWGWFIDPKPADSLAFDSSIPANQSSRVDLLSTLAHEFGHVLGVEDSAATDLKFMEPRLEAGQRTISNALLDRLLVELLDEDLF
ncbi:FG-GAP-like repeat-containing protein [Aureliella helgolandensis]|uniref:Serine-aspartate repeat-containing protein D n=1 Tax=Aureliella helgolandensis TaxID=2527968 RepID=A0A518GAG2_9BACT|nr:choice-of-anchor Q domain-containing protein [Aureliella helgolandensis]QDV25553.1 Serine-aspartate repeat-containing protein D precursor [Aureliella helgolandensis]